MKILNTMFATFLIVMALDDTGAQAPAPEALVSATYHELVVGTSTRDDLLRVLGKPEAVGRRTDLAGWRGVVTACVEISRMGEHKNTRRSA
jgi:hypothetical protein